jgi:hypothetical protein
MTTNTTYPTPIDADDLGSWYERRRPRSGRSGEIDPSVSRLAGDLADDGWSLVPERLALAVAYVARPRTREMWVYESGETIVDDGDLYVALVPVLSGATTTGWLVRIDDEYLVVDWRHAGFDSAKRPRVPVFSIFETQHDAEAVAAAIVAEILR